MPPPRVPPPELARNPRYRDGHERSRENGQRARFSFTVTDAGRGAASCRVAEKAGYAFTEVLGALPTEFPLDGHLHALRAELRQAPAQRGPGVSSAGSSDSR
ncbi:hypothetical protein ACIRPN_21665 [Streptomyces sp. NPDC101230]|uniref:hypothetical protein n=1 Tax=unclassified Streptomyces TaxID=2593676 RepID=UPI00381C6C49